MPVSIEDDDKLAMKSWNVFELEISLSDKPRLHNEPNRLRFYFLFSYLKVVFLCVFVTNQVWLGGNTPQWSLAYNIDINIKAAVVVDRLSPFDASRLLFSKLKKKKKV